MCYENRTSPLASDKLKRPLNKDANAAQRIERPTTHRNLRQFIRFLEVSNFSACPLS